MGAFTAAISQHAPTAKAAIHVSFLQFLLRFSDVTASLIHKKLGKRETTSNPPPNPMDVVDGKSKVGVVLANRLLHAPYGGKEHFSCGIWIDLYVDGNGAHVIQGSDKVYLRNVGPS
ncbi:hypothetical protein BGY98DRAFT_937652 [Russula aff. rugulosa BPL654]|nr:hypothetical protein BGY98DRAFT_937652 [Russula aff. rugulosa BPL654]